MITENTIAAISTPLGRGGIAVIRVSGKDAIAIAERVFRSSHGGEVRKFPSHTVHHGLVVAPNSQEPLDEVMLTVFRAPNSYTGEDVVEISCHGGVFVSQKVLEAVLEAGARLADPGEFTKRAFLNGKIDLVQAEAVADLIQASTERSHQEAFQQLRGGLSDQINAVRNSLVDMLALMELELDFSQEDVEFLDRQEIEERLRRSIEELDKLIASYQRGRFLREGAKITIVGRPNVGKSSLLNALLGMERAIVDETPGTTRDAIETQLDIKGVLFRVIDTAGLRQAKNRIEKKGIAITEFHIEDADVVLFLLDASEGVTRADEKIWRQVERLSQKRREMFPAKIIIVGNKIDLGNQLTKGSFDPEMGKWPLVLVSAKTLTGIPQLNETIFKAVFDERWERGDAVITNVRHLQALQKARQHLGFALETLKQGLSTEFAVVDIKGALEQLGAIVGQTTPEEVLDRIFEQFCIGK
ncbi:tRNA uridine-5-carboxymethylaminomethyl(34) synthesis GTPase MnmE [candidate division KSB1 bacterium]|nr:MAG: tRNA uridine-5-carboxymethylaminomethyl(34) synthesis GTPase MnmE [candidate division KSB1 bacterium]RKY93015.1 MAG: tRNA uridine-5-carboxymethylaminomethyl(34) synthesis GTPase MnmE [candidate division KSB1 bacterium]